MQYYYWRVLAPGNKDIVSILECTDTGKAVRNHVFEEDKHNLKKRVRRTFNNGGSYL